MKILAYDASVWEAHNDPRNYSADVIILLHIPAGQPRSRNDYTIARFT